MASSEPVLNKSLHTKYFTRCLRSLLPAPYQSTDSSLLSLSFFAVSGLDLLNTLPSWTSEQRSAHIDYIYSHMLPGSAGFVGTTTFLSGNNEADIAGAGVTSFALLTLLILGDDLKKINRAGLMQWLHSLQAANGGFYDSVPLVLPNGAAYGAVDARFAYCVAGIRYIIRGWQLGSETDIDVDALVTWLEASVTFDVAFGEGPGTEAHAGHTYTAVGALSFLDRLPEEVENLLFAGKENPPKGRSARIDIFGLTTWLLARQCPPGPETAEETPEGLPLSASVAEKLSAEAREACWRGESALAGFQGRVGKRPDTCYSFWIGGALAILCVGKLKNAAMDRRWLLQETQVPLVGGFAKVKGHHPDLLHSYFGLAALALDQDVEVAVDASDNLQALEPTLCISVKARQFHDTLKFSP